MARFKSIVVLAFVGLLAVALTGCEPSPDLVSAAPAKDGVPTAISKKPATATPYPGQPATATPATSAPVPTAQPVAPAPAPSGPCRDGEQLANVANQLDRSPLGAGDRWTINEISWSGNGFAGFDRAIIVLAPLGNQFAVHVLSARTVHVMAFCGDGPAVTDWAVKAHVPSLQQASQDKNGNRPSETEIPVVWIDFAGNGAFNVVKEAKNGPNIDTIRGHVEVSKAK